MSTYTSIKSLFRAIADAIRAKTGGSADIIADNFPTAIAAIPTGGSGSGGNIEKASGSKYFDADYESLTPYAIAHGLSQKPKVVYFWTGVTYPVAERQYIGSVWVENLALGTNSGLVNLGATIMNSGSTVGTQSGLYQAKNAPDATNIYIYIASTSNKIPAGTTVYWEAIAW